MPASAVSSLRHLRLVGYLEGASFLVLLLIAMPLKYALGIAMAVRIAGWAHGLLFLWYLFALARTASEIGWPLTRVAQAFVVSVVPFGVFVFDPSLRREQAALERERTPST